MQCTQTPHTARHKIVRVTAFVLGALLTVACEPKFDEAEAQRVLEAMRSSPEPEPELAPALWRDEVLFDPSRTPAWDEPSEAFWRMFRSAHPFGLQGLIVSKPRADGSSTVIVAEPPPHVSLEDLKEFLPDASVASQPVGHGGALFDVVGTIRGTEEEVAQKLRALSVLLYRTDHKAFAYTTPFRKSWRDAPRYHLDIQPTAAELNTWLHADNARFVPVTGGDALSLAELTRSPAGGVYRLADAGVVAWWIPETSVVGDNIADVRIFALESDLIIGAVKEGGLLVLGRQRLAPFDVLPPLRAETVVLLASVQGEDQLEQSYQRSHAGAGTYSRAFDWAPILLSPELVDTEYGHLLNIADQLLKGWSQHGEVSYENFAYPPPTTWPFDKALSEIVWERFGKDSITFNWNTTGAGYVVEMEGRQLYVPYRTAALPVSYIPGEDQELAPECVPYEERAYRWYNGLNNPTLVRVVQYAALYQIFHNLGVGAPREHAPKSHVPEQQFANAIERLWTNADAVRESELGALAKASPLTARVRRFVGGQVTRHAAERGEKDQEAVAEFRHRMEARSGADATAVVAKRLREGFALWRSMTPFERSELAAAARSLDGAGVDPESGAKLEQLSTFLASVAARTQIPEKYTEAVPADGRSWIHTPVVVLSSAGLDNPGMVGGHNIRAQATHFASSGQVARGEVEIAGNVLRLHPEDIERAPMLVWQASRELRAGKPSPDMQARLSALLRDSPAPVPRTSTLALGLPKTPAAEPLSSPGIRTVSARVPPPPEVVQLASTTQGSQITIVKHEEHLWVAGPDKAALLITSNVTDAAELVAVRMRSMPKPSQREPVRVDSVNLSDAERNALMTEMRARARDTRFSEDGVAIHVQETGKFPSLDPADYDLANPRIRVLESQSLGSESFARLYIEFAPIRSGLKARIMEVWIWIKGAISDLQLKSMVRAFELRVEELFLGTARGEAASDLLIQLTREVKRLKKHYGVDIEAQVKDGASDWYLTEVPDGRSARHG
jgi:hypothetical protein